jgi:DNA-binding transcriptional regulator YiaG
VRARRPNARRSRPAFTAHLTPIAGEPPSDAMSPEEFAEILEQLNLSQLAVGRLLGVDARTPRRWAMGQVPIQPPVARFLRFLARAKISPVFIMETLAR